MFDAAEGAAKRIGFVAETVSRDAAGLAARATQTQFTVAPDQAQKLLDGLTEALRRLRAATREADDIRRTGSPGKDVYSGLATMAIHRTAGEEEGGYQWANAKAQEALEKTIRNINDALAQYRQTESAVTDAFKPEG